MRIRLFRDNEGYPRAERSKSCKVLALFLEAEIQQDQQWGQEIIQVIDNVRNHKVDNWEETGNANTLILTPEKAKIVNEFTNETCELSLGDLRQAIWDWLTFIQQS